MLSFFSFFQKSYPGYLCAKDIQKFQISYKVEKTDIQPSLVEVDSETTSYNLTRLRPHQNYEIKIISISDLFRESDPIVQLKEVRGKRKNADKLSTRNYFNVFYSENICKTINTNFLFISS